jgi:hypothetical protein
MTQVVDCKDVDNLGGGCLEASCRRAWRPDEGVWAYVCIAKLLDAEMEFFRSLQRPGWASAG